MQQAPFLDLNFNHFTNEYFMALYIGLMSGTSMDGIDAALVEIPSNRLIYGITKKYSDAVKKQLEHLIAERTINLASFCQLNTLVGREFAAAVLELLHAAQVTAESIEAIGSHGQTVCHDAYSPIPYTLQLGCPHTISSLTGINVVADFRTRDIVNGGQGAPFAPLYHQELFSNQNTDLALVNVGGIANVTLIRPDQETCGWDVGPGNCLMDAWIYQHQGICFDANGDWARQGVLIQSLLDNLLADSFFKKAAPKSIGKEYFSLSWLKPHLRTHYKAVDVQATLLALTAYPIAEALVPSVKQLYLCGGGAHNTRLLHTLSSLLPEVRVNSISDAGLSADYLEAMMFAWFAAQTVRLNPLDLRTITGSKKTAILGALYPVS